jgi:hypothetical protein
MMTAKDLVGPLLILTPLPAMSNLTCRRPCGLFSLGPGDRENPASDRLAGTGPSHASIEVLRKVAVGLDTTMSSLIRNLERPLAKASASPKANPLSLSTPRQLWC